MDNIPISTRPLSEQESTLRKKFFDSLAAQSDLMDKIGEHLITVELAIPGIYATILKLLNGDEAVVVRNIWFYLTFVFWALALLSTFIAIVPRRYRVDTNLLHQDSKSNSKIIGVEDFFTKTANFKQFFIIVSSLFFFAGTFCIIFTIG